MRAGRGSAIEGLLYAVRCVDVQDAVNENTWSGPRDVSLGWRGSSGNCGNRSQI